MSYNEQMAAIESKWQRYWEDSNSFRAANPGEAGSEKEKFYCLGMFPYPSGQGLHVGHAENYTATDIVSRYKRMCGYNVLHPMGWDAFGLPAEQYAIQTGISPQQSTAGNIKVFKDQMQKLGLSYDWSREICTADPKFYKWTQTIFKWLYEKGLAYEKKGLVNWCPELGTVLANDEVIEGKSERGGFPVERRPMRQWYLKITAFAEKLLHGLETIDWPNATKEHQKHWIGKSVGAEIDFKLIDSEDRLRVFTTRPDTLMGVSFMVIAPEHPWVDRFCTDEYIKEIRAYQKRASAKSDLQRTDLNKDKSGIFTGGYVIHPISGEKIQVWIADYVMMGYGTGAIMAVPAHDERDEHFAKKFDLEIIQVISEDGVVINSDHGDFKINCVSADEAVSKVISLLEKKGVGRKKINYKLHDWTFSRQRYWGEPIPVVHIGDGERGEIKLLADSELPLTLPEISSYAPSGSGESPLATVKDWIQVNDKSGTALRESNTMPGSAGSSWYWLRYMDPTNEKEAWSKDIQKYWGQVDLYVGGPEHAVGHLLYSRFWQKVFFELGLVSHDEPFKKLVHQGMILGEDGEKMSKRRGNVIDPSDLIKTHGADSLRMYLMFMGPIEKAKPWQTKGVDGLHRFLNRVWNLCIEETGELKAVVEDKAESEWDPKLVTLFHQCIKQVTADLEHLKFNTAISQLMVLCNELIGHVESKGFVPKKLMEVFSLLLAPFAPHIAEELWQKLGNTNSLIHHPWPQYDDAKTIVDTIELVVQVNGKVRDKIEVSRSITETELKELVLAREKVQKWIDGKEIRKFIYVKGRLVSIVI